MGPSRDAAPRHSRDARVEEGANAAGCWTIGEKYRPEEAFEPSRDGSTRGSRVVGPRNDAVSSSDVTFATGGCHRQEMFSLSREPLMPRLPSLSKSTPPSYVPERTVFGNPRRMEEG